MPNVLKPEKRVAIVAALTEGCSIRSTARMVGVSRNTVTKLLVELGEACTAYQDKVLRHLTCKRVQCDEIWSFVYAKASWSTTSAGLMAPSRRRPPWQPE